MLQDNHIQSTSECQSQQKLKITASTQKPTPQFPKRCELMERGRRSAEKKRPQPQCDHRLEDTLGGLLLQQKGEMLASVRATKRASKFGRKFGVILEEHDERRGNRWSHPSGKLQILDVFSRHAVTRSVHVGPCSARPISGYFTSKSAVSPTMFAEQVIAVFGLKLTVSALITLTEHLPSRDPSSPQRQLVVLTRDLLASQSGVDVNCPACQKKQRAFKHPLPCSLAA